MSAVRRQQEIERRQSQTEMIAVLIERGLEASDVFHFNKAVTLININWQRGAFHAWCKANDVPMYNTLGEWENYARAFETDGAAADERDTQADALQ